jgi:hypothetical protein
MTGGRNLVVASAVALAVASFAPASARAVDVARYDFQGAAGICAPSLPVHGANLRARPLALVNEGTSDVFVTCTFFGDDTAGGRAASRIAINIGNEGAATAIVSCTLVNGFASGSAINATYSTKSSAVFSRTGVFLSWTPQELGGTPASIQRAAVQCRLPARTALHYVGIHYPENIGN